MKMTYPTKRSGYTLVEILVAVTLSLLLLLGVTDMFRYVGDTINETQATINMGQNLGSAAIVLRNDLGGIREALATQAQRLVASNGTAATDGGYLEIIEGQGAPDDVIKHGTAVNNTKLSFGSHTETHDPGKHIPRSWTAYTPDNDLSASNPVNTWDRTVTDNDDILAFTISGKGAFRGLVDGKLQDSSSAEVIWFVRGTHLYRRVLIIPAKGPSSISGSYTDDIPFYNSPAELARDGVLDRRENRYGRIITSNNFPFPLRGASADKELWYYLGMPTLEETINTTTPWTHGDLPNRPRTTVGYRNSALNSSNPITVPSAGATWSQANFIDYWNAPNDWTDLDPLTGSLSNYVDTPRNSRAGEDIILTNVIGFDVKVWNPYWVPCNTDADTKWAPPQFIDLGQDKFNIGGTVYDVLYTRDLTTNIPNTVPRSQVGYGFTLKGRYNTVSGVRRTLSGGGTDKWVEADQMRETDNNSPPTFSYSTTAHSGSHMSCVYDSWSSYYYTQIGSITGLTADQVPDPPYSEPLTGIQVTIRCFEPLSGNIKQIRVTRHF